MKIIFLLPVLFLSSFLTGQPSLPEIPLQGVENEETKEVYEIRIFPNPVLHTFIIEVELNLIAEETLRFELYNISGKRVLLLEHLSQPVEIVERGHLPEGHYTYILKSTEKVFKTGRLIFSAF